MHSAVLKAVPEDFVVSEAALPSPGSGDGGRYEYLRLRKRGFTTFEAIERVAAGFGVPRSAISAAGLKDEDGVTEQTISLDGTTTPQALAAFNESTQDGSRWVTVSPAGRGDRAVEIGELVGNVFALTLRDLGEDLATRLRDERTIDLFFVNYFDTQRFGVPGGPKQTHLIGGALLAGDHDTALELVRASGSAEGEKALRHEGDGESFFAGLDQRVVSFYLCAHSSFAWNSRVAELVATTAGDQAVPTTKEGIDFLLPTSPGAVLALAGEQRSACYDKYRWTGEAMRHTVSRRRTVVQTEVTVTSAARDELFPRRWRAGLSFFLPSGCYATNAVAQLLLQVT
ncbi:tRNA pseudouridine(13) synthase TruD [Lentzea sp. NPDC034063]|uniref:tRNA pseudouridine(13) synthase TruD n=1 Tax=unclassified Lentzea TaxID=2643253 RepID=UPI0033C4E6A5